MSESPETTAGIRRRDPVVLDTVARASLHRLLRTARAAGLTREQAEDAVQATLLTFCQRASEFDGRARASTWLFGILAHKILEARRSVARHTGTDDIDGLMASRFTPAGRWQWPADGPLSRLARKEVRELLAGCLEELPERQRQVFELRDVEQLSSEEACNVLGVTANYVGVLLYRARNRLRECLEQKGIRRSADVVL